MLHRLRSITYGFRDILGRGGRAASASAHMRLASPTTFGPQDRDEMLRAIFEANLRLRRTMGFAPTMPRKAA